MQLAKTNSELLDTLQTMCFCLRHSSLLVQSKCKMLWVRCFFKCVPIGFSIGDGKMNVKTHAKMCLEKKHTQKVLIKKRMKMMAFLHAKKDALMSPGTRFPIT